MRILVFFDLPTAKKKQRKIHTRFRKFLLNDGYSMMQYSIYCRFCVGLDAVKKHSDRLHKIAPTKGSIRLMVVTDKQFGEMKIVIGDITPTEKTITAQQLSIF